MSLDFYSKGEGVIATSSSRGRPHFQYRKKVATLNNYTYTLSYGENLYTLSAVVFGNDSLWWVLADINPAKDVFSYDVGDVVYLPGEMVVNNGGERIY